MSKNVIILLVRLGHFHLSCRQREWLALEFLYKKREILGVLAAAKARPSSGEEGGNEGGREGALYPELRAHGGGGGGWGGVTEKVLMGLVTEMQGSLK